MFVEAQQVLPPSLKPEPHQRDPYNWQDRHEAVKKQNREVKPDYVIIGDSITHHWGGLPDLGSRKTGLDSWAALFGKHPVTNMGFGFDYADNAYYRIQNGELDGISPRVILMLIGTNNLGHRKDTADDCAKNIGALVKLVRQKCPNSKILLLGILPRREKDLADTIEQTNKLLARLADRKYIFFAEPGKKMKGADGVAFPAYFRDVVHPNAKGYELLTEELKPLLKRLDSKYTAAQ